MKETRFNFPVK